MTLIFDNKNTNMWKINPYDGDYYCTFTEMIIAQGYSGETKKEMTNFKPKQIIQREDSKTTVLIWDDDSKTIVQCSPDEEFVPEFGIAMATMNKIYGNRNQFKKYTEKKTFWQDKIKGKKENK